MIIGDWFGSTEDLARRDREVLLDHVTGYSTAAAMADATRTISAADLERLDLGIAALRRGEPLAYVIGEWEFWSLPLHVNPQVLIPRPETELLVEWAIEHCPPQGKLLDLGTGSGAVAIAIAHTRGDIEVTACDNSAEALQVAARNAQRNNVSVRFARSDWYNHLSDRWDIIVANPPYVATGDEHLPALRYEPTEALVAGTEGLDSIALIIEGGRRHLTPGGLLALEHGYDQAARVRHMLTATGFSGVDTRRDLAGIERLTYGAHLTHG